MVFGFIDLEKEEMVSYQSTLATASITATRIGMDKNIQQAREK